MKRPIVISENYTNLSSESFRAYLKDISQIDLFDSPEDEFECAQKAVSGDTKAKDELIMRNLRFVVSVAKKYENENAPLSDLINQGNIGLIDAANRFDPTMGNKFISYAVWSIRKEIMEYLNNCGRTIRIPTSKTNHISRFNDEVNKLIMKEGREVSHFEMYDNLEGFTEYEIDNMINVENLRVLSYDRKMVSDEGEGSSMLDILESDTDATDHLILEGDRKYLLNKLFSLLTEKQKKVIKLYFGIDNSGLRMNLSEIGYELGMTREGVRQVKEKALRLLQVKSRKLGLKEFPF